MKTLIKYTDLLKENKRLKDELAGKPAVGFHILNNITVNMLKDVLEYNVRMMGVNPDVQVHDYDTIVQDSMAMADDKKAKIVFWELANYMPGLYYKADEMDNAQLQQLIDKVKNDINLVFGSLASSSIVFVNTFCATPFAEHDVRKSNLRIAEEVLNQYLEQQKPDNVFLVDVKRVYERYSLETCIDMRMFNSSKSLHTLAFFQGYVEEILPVLRSVMGKAKKALIFDCDNTLWGGILGEDGFEGIQMAEDGKGKPFHLVQRMAVELSKKGIIIGLNSKNNAADVDEVLEKHPDMYLRDEHIVIKKVNWQDKVGNLRQIAADLNIGIDSLVFIDDSNFEVNFIREQLPEVLTFQVPKAAHEYPAMIKEVSRLFYHHSQTKEDLERIKMYKQEQQRESQKDSFGNLEEYLSSLGIVIKIFKDDSSLIPRTAQMTQKTNQFNLTTQRYTENDIKQFIESPDYGVYVFEVSDKFGSYGITGLSIAKTKGGEAQFDSFLMSCRVLGRKIESSFLSYIIEDLKKSGVEKVTAKYSKTAKNAQVEPFYDNNGFEVLQQNDSEKHYSLTLNNWQAVYPDFITIQLAESGVNA